MNKKVIILVLGVIALGVVGIVLVNLFSGPAAGGTKIKTTEQVIENPRPAVKARENSFGVMTPEQKAAAEEAAARKELEALASSTASSTETTEDSSSEAEE